ncbi:uncharacterized protein BJ212DRAFT_1479178 [Suillus subaureus]|uniref:Uncharacterized protein n=1 Tax=Suillus subaureus TaxID=48587 RepID=A0A9P7EF33_9AGAM|nr:uncharacterized protein BJ212DRAFT_1479178 [Suillus subaureus]KAG1819058.1 hypothetical protein BJ212DRAFT_1479178 [Suillus subaureus]
MTSDICSGSDAGSPRAPLSPVDEVPRPHQANQSILYNVPKSPSTKWSILHRHFLKSPSHHGKPGLKSPSQHGKSPTKLFASPSHHGQYLCEQMSQKHIPYAFHPAPLELQFAARVSGQGSRPEFMAEEIHQWEEIISKGFSNLSLATLYQLFKSKLAGQEATHQHLVTTTWELEASEWYTTFLDGLYRENKDHLLFSDEELKRIRNVFTDWSQEEIDDNVNYLQAIYDDNCEILRTVTAQADVLKKHLGSCASEDVLGSMGKSSHYPQFVGKPSLSSDTDDSMDDDEGTDDDDNEEDDCIHG